MLTMSLYCEKPRPLFDKKQPAICHYQCQLFVGIVCHYTLVFCSALWLVFFCYEIDDILQGVELLFIIQYGSSVV